MSDPPEELRMPITGHLTELRRRLIGMVLVVVVGCGGSFFFSDWILNELTRPLKTSLIFTSPTEALWSHLKVSFFCGILLAVPFILYQVYQFIAPGLLRQERRQAVPFIFFGSVFFATGLLFCYFVVFPITIQFLMTYKTAALIPMISIGTYVDFLLKFLLAFGLVFELPVVLVFFTRLGLWTPEFLSRHRKYAVLVNFILAAVLTPTPDVFNQLLMALPLILLYELGIWGSRWFGTRKADDSSQDPRQVIERM